MDKQQLEHIEKLLQRYDKAHTTNAEEQELANYFRTADDIPDEWNDYKTLFHLLVSTQSLFSEDELDALLPQQKQNRNHLKPWRWAAVLATLVIVGASIIHINSTSERIIQEKDSKAEYTNIICEDSTNTDKLVAQTAKEEKKNHSKTSETEPKSNYKQIYTVGYAKPQTPDNDSISQYEKLQGKIAGLTIVPTSADLGPGNVMRLIGTNANKNKDSVLVLLNGEDVSASFNTADDNLSFYQLFENLYRKGLLFSDANVWKDEKKMNQYRPKFGNRVNNGIIEITAKPYVSVEKLAPIERAKRRKTYLINKYEEGTAAEIDVKGFNFDLFDDEQKQYFLGLKTLQLSNGTNKRATLKEYIGGPKEDYQGIYVPLHRRLEYENPYSLPPSAMHWVEDFKPCVTQAEDKIIEYEGDSVTRYAFIYGGKIQRKDLAKTPFHLLFDFQPNANDSSVWYGTVELTRKKLSVRLHSIDKLYAKDYPDMQQNAFHIEGRVVDKTTGEAIYGATVSDKLGGCGTVTDWDGHFSYTFPFRPSQITASFIGYQRTVINHPKHQIEIKLTENTSLKEVKVPKKEEMKQYQGIEIR